MAELSFKRYLQWRKVAQKGRKGWAHAQKKQQQVIDKQIS
jgi:hypothetical protein